MQLRCNEVGKPWSIGRKQKIHYFGELGGVVVEDLSVGAGFEKYM